MNKKSPLEKNNKVTAREQICKNTKEWEKIGESVDYLVKTSEPGITWRDLLGRKDESYN